MEITRDINTLSTAPTDYDNDEQEDFMVPHLYLNGLRFLFESHMRSFDETGDVYHYIKAQKLKNRIRAILAK